MTDTSPTTVNRTLPKRLVNSAYRVREYLTEKEVERLIEAAKKRGETELGMLRLFYWRIGMATGLKSLASSVGLK
jgi:integrase